MIMEFPKLRQNSWIPFPANHEVKSPVEEVVNAKGLKFVSSEAILCQMYPTGDIDTTDIKPKIKCTGYLFACHPNFSVVVRNLQTEHAANIHIPISWTVRLHDWRTPAY